MTPLLVALLVTASTTRIVVEGNKVLPDDVYRTVLALEPVRTTTTSSQAHWRQFIESDPDRAAAEAKEQIWDFLLSSGYDLARVDASVRGSTLYLRIDEGQLDRIIFLDEGTFSNIELRFSVHLPSEVFNRPLLEELLDTLIRDTSITGAHWELVPTKPVEHAGIQVKEPPLIRGLRLLNPGSHHALHIRLERAVPKEGLSLGLGFSGSDGFYGKVRYRMGNAVFRRDRLDAEARAGFYLGDEIESDRNPFGISRMQGKVRWSPIPLGADQIRAYVSFEADLTGRRRNDLQILNYYFMPIGGSLVFEAELGDAVTLTVGGGGERRLFFGVDDGGQMLPLLENTPDDDGRFFLHAGAEIILNPSELRADRKHRIGFRGRFLGKGASARARPITKLFLDYDNTISLGWDELRFGFHGAHLWGRIPFYEELSIGDGFLRSGFGTQIYVQRVAAVYAEYRISLSRDTLKISAFNDFAMYEKLDEARQGVAIRVADTFGAGANVLLFDAFQINVYVGVTVAQERGLDLGVKAELARAF